MKKNKILLLVLLGLSALTIAHTQISKTKIFQNNSGINGTLYSEEGTPLSNAKIELLLNSKVVQSLISRPEGAFNFDSLEANTYQIKCNKSGFDQLTFFIKINPNETITKNLVMFRKKKTDTRTSKSEKIVIEESESDMMDYSLSSPLMEMHSIKKTGSMDKPSYSEPATRGSEGKGKHGVLTAGETKDFNKWNLWDDLTKGEFKPYAKLWGLVPNKRFTVQLMNKINLPLVDREVRLMDEKNNILYTAKTDNTGKCELWLSVESMETQFKVSKLKIQADLKDKTHEIKRIREFNEGINTLKINESCNQSNVVDILFTVDATGSMGDEINYLKSDMDNLISTMKLRNPSLQFNFGSVFYRDKTDEYLVKKHDFSANNKNFLDFLNHQDAKGGGDFPEAVDAALETSINQMNWSSNARTRLMFLFLDAPPHQDNETIKRIQKLTLMAAKKNIRIIPIGCSGIDKSTEYLMRAMALATNGNYVFLTDHSGIGNPHIKASTDAYQVETLSDILLRNIDQFTFIPSCENDTKRKVKSDTLVVSTPKIIDHVIIDSSRFAQKDTIKKDSTKTQPNDSLQFVFKAYPNPTNGPLTIEVSTDIDKIYISDFTGKIVEIIYITKGELKVRTNLEQYASGTYFVKAWQNNKWVYGKIILNNRKSNS